MKRNLVSRTINELSEWDDGLTNAELLKIINDKKLTHQLLKYYLDDLTKDKIIKKSGTKYILLRKTFIVKGSAVIEFENKLVFLDCPYFGNECKCCNNNHINGGDCLLMNDLPDVLKEKFIKEEEDE